MGRPKTRQEGEKYRYDQQYLKDNIQVVNVPFNRRKPEDVLLLDWLGKLNEKKTPYIKRLIREDMTKSV